MGRVVVWGSVILTLVFALAAVWVYPETDLTAKCGVTASIFGGILVIYFLGWLFEVFD